MGDFNINPQFGIPDFIKQNQRKTLPRKRVYCKDCRFLRQKMENGEPAFANILLSSEPQPVYVCVAPDNIGTRGNWLGRSPIHSIHPPDIRNRDGNCPAYETVQDCTSGETPGHSGSLCATQ